MTIFESLRKDHNIQRDLVERLIETHGDTEKRDELFNHVSSELKSHAVAEERHFYIPLLKHDMTQEKSRHSVAEHHELDELIEQLEKTEYSSPSWLTIARKLADKITHHLDEEEHEVFQLAGKVLSDAQKSDLSDSYNREMKIQRDEFS